MPCILVVMKSALHTILTAKAAEHAEQVERCEHSEHAERLNVAKVAPKVPLSNCQQIVYRRDDTTKSVIKCNKT